MRVSERSRLKTRNDRRCRHSRSYSRVVSALADLVSLLSGSTWLSSVLYVLSVLVVYSERRPGECGCHDWEGVYISSPKPVEGRECVIERE